MNDIIHILHIHTCIHKSSVKGCHEVRHKLLPVNVLSMLGTTSKNFGEKHCFLSMFCHFSQWKLGNMFARNIGWYES